MILQGIIFGQDIASYIMLYCGVMLHYIMLFCRTLRYSTIFFYFMLDSNIVFLMLYLYVHCDMFPFCHVVVCYACFIMLY